MCYPPSSYYQNALLNAIPPSAGSPLLNLSLCLLNTSLIPVSNVNAPTKQVKSQTRQNILKKKIFFLIYLFSIVYFCVNLGDSSMLAS